jgi:hypothetical protein
MPPLAVANLAGFLALRETQPCPELQALADLCVAAVDAHRAPASSEELARRRRHGLSRTEDAMLERWGYPHVFTTWRFHMTLTQLMPPERHALFRPAAEAHVADAVAQPRMVDSLSLFMQPCAGAPFTLCERIPLRG